MNEFLSENISNSNPRNTNRESNFNRRYNNLNNQINNRVRNNYSNLLNFDRDFTSDDYEVSFHFVRILGYNLFIKFIGNKYAFL